MESIRNDASSDAVAELWAMFRKHLAARTREINEEVAHYPRPIARCDVQLSKLLEERFRVFQQMNRAVEMGPMPPANVDAHWLQRLSDYLANLESCSDDDIETSLRARLLNAMAQVRG
ncbi:MAG: hypothetical protein E6H71_03360 [Betaproteobacteria bacterium]|nr:MAG: hypothetical protein E6H71_03360 [Betaproteobacteria bacterium]